MTIGSNLFANQYPAQARFSKPGGVKGEIADLRRDVAATFLGLVAVGVDEFTNPAAADADGLRAAITSAITAIDYDAEDLTGAIGAVFTYPRNVTVTCDDSATTWAGSVTFTGLDIDGNVITEAVALTNNATTAGAKAFKEITAVHIPAQENTSGTITLGMGALLGLSRTIKSRAGVQSVISEIAAGSRVVNGTFAAAATGAPHGTYSPNSAPNGTNDYVVFYEYVPD